MELTEVVAGLREASRLTQAQLATRAGVQQSTIARYESGAASPTLASVVRLLDAVGLRAVVRLVAATGEIDARIAESLAATPAARLAAYAEGCDEVLGRLAEGRVECFVVGELAAVLHGVPLPASRPEIWVVGDPANLDRLASTAGWAWHLRVPGELGNHAVRRTALERLERWVLRTTWHDIALRVVAPAEAAGLAADAVSWTVDDRVVRTVSLVSALAGLVDSGAADSAVVGRFLAAVGDRASDRPALG